VPRVVDVEERRRELGEAVWRVIRRDGLAEASVRTVAQEAGLSTGSLRHYFGTQTELLVFAMRLVMARVEERVSAVERPTDAREAAGTVLAELLPLDDERRAENEVWLAFTAQALVRPELHALRAEAYTALWSGCLRWVRRLLPTGTPADEVELEAHRLFALLDGLAVHAAVDPVHSSPQRLVDVLGRHLDAIGGRDADRRRGRNRADGSVTGR